MFALKMLHGLRLHILQELHYTAGIFFQVKNVFLGCVCTVDNLLI